MSDKVKLPKEVAEAIERFRNIKCSNADIIYMFASGQDKENISFADFASDNFDTLLQALVNGYEVEQTPEDKVRDYYNHCLKRAEESTDVSIGNGWRNESCGVRNTLILLNIKVEGVNT